jgi:hypothetical protein
MGQIKDHKVGIGYFFAKHAALNSENKYWLSRNKDEEVVSGGTYIPAYNIQHYKKLTILI